MHLDASLRRIGALLTAGLLLIGVVSIATGTSYIDLTTAGANHTDSNGGVWIQGGIGSGTGTFDPFLTYKSNTDTEEAVNVCDDPGCPDPQFNTTSVSSGNTHELLASGIPVIEHDGALYREFTLDANDTGKDDWMSIDNVEIYLSTDKNLGDYPFSSADAMLIYSLPDDAAVLMRSQTLSPGSGVSDITLLVPSELFGEDCYYGSPTCNDYVFFHTASGGAGTVDGENYNVTAGFEEWRVSLQPVVNVSKTAVPSFDRTYDWSISKTVSDESISLFNGDSQEVTWSVTPTRGPAQDSNWKVTGEITVANPTGSSPIPTAIPATVNSVNDVIDGSLNATVDCPVSFPTTLAAGDSFVCTYSYTYGAQPPAGTHTNVATANIDVSDTETFNYSGTADFDFADATPTETDATATLTDDRAPLDESLDGSDSGQAITYNETFSCDEDEGTQSNTATLVEGTSGTERTSTASTTVTCYGLTVSKDANTSFDRDYSWTIEKSVTPTSIDLFNGAPEADVDWTITPHRSAPSDSNYAVSGTITITNPAPMAAEDVSVTDLVSGGVSATVDCDPSTTGNQTTVDVPANSSASCTYSAALSDGTTRTNTATATLFGSGYDSDPVSVDFSTATITTTDDTATVTDPTVGVNQAAVDGEGIPVDGGASCPGDAGTHNNTATVTADDSHETATANASYTVTCYGLSVSKTATTTFTRDYDWSIAKARVIGSGETDGDGLPSTLTLDEGQTYTANYQVVVTQTTHTDSDWAVHGTITVSNSAPMAAEDVAVSDLISPDDIAATVDCDPNTLGDQATVDVPAEGSAECSYSSPLDSADARTNVATATLFGIGYDSDSVDVTFDNTPDVEIDECVVVTDDNGTPGDTSDDTTLGTVCLDDLNSSGQYTFEYTLDIGPYAACGTYHFINTAAYTTQDDENETDENGASAYDVTVEVPCPAGCTLTQGYWKTHNDSFKGGAPTDETWLLIGPAAENTEFFLSGQSYFQVMWTAPKGNAYYNLAHQYIAAQLNMLDGADGSAIQDAFDEATALFQHYTPAQVGAAKGKSGKELRSQFISLAGILGSYNEGLIGPGHCDEDATSGSADAATLTSTVTVADRRTTFLI